MAAVAPFADTNNMAVSEHRNEKKKKFPVLRALSRGIGLFERFPLSNALCGLKSSQMFKNFALILTRVHRGSVVSAVLLGLLQDQLARCKKIRIILWAERIRFAHLMRHFLLALIFG